MQSLGLSVDKEYETFQIETIEKVVKLHHSATSHALGILVSEVFMDLHVCLKNVVGSETLCFMPQRECCSNSSHTVHNLTEPLFSETGCHTNLVVTFIKWKHCIQEYAVRI